MRRSYRSSALSCLVIFVAAVAAFAGCGEARAQATTPSAPAAAEAPATTRLQATLYEVRVAPESIATLDAARLAREADFAKALDALGKKRILYAVDQKVNLAGDRLMTASKYSES